MLGSHPLRSPGLPVKHGHSGVQKPHFLQTSTAGLKWGAAGHPARTPPRGRERFYPLSCGARGVQPAQDPGICSSAVRLCEKRAGPRGAHPGGGGPRRERARCGAEERRGRARRRWCRVPLSASGPGGARQRLEGLERLRRTQGLAGELTVRQQSRRAPGGRASCERREQRLPWERTRQRAAGSLGPRVGGGARRPPTVRRRVACRKRRLPEASPAGSVTCRKRPRGGLGGRDRDRGIKQGNDLRGWTCQPTLPWKSFRNIHTRASNRQVVPRKFAQCYLSVTSQ